MENLQHDALTTFLCQHAQVSDPSQINPYKGCFMPSHEILKSRLLRCEFNAEINQPMTTVCLGDGDTKVRLLNNPVPREPFFDKESAPNFDRTCVFAIKASHYTSDVPDPVSVRLNYKHTSMNALMNQEEGDQMQENAGGIKGAFCTLGPTEQAGNDIDIVALRALGFAYTNMEFVRTMTLVCKENLENGIVFIPPDVCDAAKLPVFKGYRDIPPEVLDFFMKSKENPTEKDRQEFIERWNKEQHEMFDDMPKIKSYVAIPHNHVLSWAFQSIEYLSEHNMRAFNYNVNGEVLYYIVCDVYYERVKKEVLNNWVGKVDYRPLNSIGLEFVAPKQTKGTITLGLTLQYFVAPKSLTKNQVFHLAPILSPNFPKAEEWTINRG